MDRVLLGQWDWSFEGRSVRLLPLICEPVQETRRETKTSFSPTTPWKCSQVREVWKNPRGDQETSHLGWLLMMRRSSGSSPISKSEKPSLSSCSSMLTHLDRMFRLWCLRNIVRLVGNVYVLVLLVEQTFVQRQFWGTAVRKYGNLCSTSIKMANLLKYANRRACKNKKIKYFA